MPEIQSPTGSAHLIDLAEASLRWTKPHVARSLEEFAEAEVVLPPSSDYAGLKFRCDRQPFTRLLFNELDSEHWQTHVVCGPSQSSKTLCAFAIPILHTIFELREDTGMATPESDMAADKWKKDLEPVIDASPTLARYKPKVGSGSRGGVVRDAIRFGNGRDIKLFSRGGDDTNKAGYSLRIMKVTEAAGWSQPGINSQEGGPLRQLYARLRGKTRSRRRLTIEGTVTTAYELPWALKGDGLEVIRSSNSRLVTPCPHCGAWISPERENLKGWQKAESEDEAANGAYWECPDCSGHITEEQRKTSNRDVRIVHHGQEIKPNGEITGGLPPTSTLWFRWSSWHNCLIETTADAAVDEWLGAQLPEDTEEAQLAEKELCQFVHCAPFRPRVENRVDLKREVVKQRCDRWEQNILPPDTTHLTLAVDPGKRYMWWLAMAFRACGEFYIPAYGRVQVVIEDHQSVKARLMAALWELFETTANRGWTMEGRSGKRYVQRIWIDAGDWPDEIAAVVRQTHDKKLRLTQQRFRLCRGRGASQMAKMNTARYQSPSKHTQRTLEIGQQWHGAINFDRRLIESTFNADWWKLWVHDALAVTPGNPGALTFFQKESAHQHATLATHFCNERYVATIVPGKGIVNKWERQGHNHWLDCAAMCGAAADHAGYPWPEPEPEKETDGANWYRQRLK